MPIVAFVTVGLASVIVGQVTVTVKVCETVPPLPSKTVTVIVVVPKAIGVKV